MSVDSENRRVRLYVQGLALGAALSASLFAMAVGLLLRGLDFRAMWERRCGEHRDPLPSPPDPDRSA